MEQKKIKKIHQIEGSKSEDAPDPPYEAPNTLQSRAIARFVDLLCEGEIDGLVNGEQSVFFDNIPIRNPENVYNYDGVKIEFKPGSPDSIPLNDFPTSESEFQVDAKITQEVGPVSKIIQNPDVDRVRLRFNIPSLFTVVKRTGDILPTKVQWRIDIKPDGGNFVVAKQMKKSGKCIASYETDVILTDLSRVYGPGPWTIRVVRITADSESNNLQNNLYWSSYTEIINRVMIYPHSAVIGTTLNSQQFGSRIPARSFEVRGLRIQVPSNYNPVRRRYSGIWDGTFKIEYSNNPAWVWYDIVNNNRYGLGLDAEYIDKWTLYTIGQYCDQLVPDSFGDYEPRFTFNGVLQSRTDAIHVLTMVSSAFRCMPFWAGGKASVSQDSPKDPVKLVTAANVIDGVFSYTGSALEDRYNVVNVSWNDPDNFYKLQVETVDDQEGIERYGYKETDITAVGCTSRGQAYRFGRWFLYTSLNELETMTYRASWDQADLLPGDIILVLDPHYANARNGGRTSGVGTNTLTLDAPVTLDIGQSYTLFVIAKDGSVVENDVTTTSDGQEHTTLTCDDNWEVGNEPLENGIWILKSTDLEPRQFRVMTNTEVEKNIFEITCVEYDANKFAEVEDGKIFAPPPLTKVPPANTQIVAPTNIQYEVYSYEDTGAASERADRKFGILLSWTHTRDTRFQNYDVQWRAGDEAWGKNQLYNTAENFYDIKPIISGTYDFRVRATGLGRESDFLSIEDVVIAADPDAPPDITSLVVVNGPDANTFSGPDCEIAWDPLQLEVDSTAIAIYDGTAPTHYATNTDTKLTKIRDYRVQVYKLDDTLLRTEYTIEPNFKYYFGMNLLDNGVNPLRTFKFSVVARDVYDQLSNTPTVLVVSNPAPTMAGLTPSVDNIFTGLKVDWSAIVPSDNDLAKFRLYIDTNNPPTTLISEVSKNTTRWVEPNLTPSTTYRVQVEPYDEFGVGTKSAIANGVPTKLAQDDIEGELVSRLRLTDSMDSTSLLYLVDNITNTGALNTYDNGSWIEFKFPVDQLLDRVSVWANQSVQCYFSTSLNGTDWDFYKAEADHTLDTEGRLLNATNEGDAQTNYWTTEGGDGDINVALFPNGLNMAYARIHFINNGNQVYELRFTDQVIAEWIVARDLSAISADLGAIAAGTLQSQNLDATSGVFIDLDNETIQFGGTVNPSLSWDGSKVELNIGDDGKINIGREGEINVGVGGNLNIGDGGLVTFGDNIQFDTSPETGVNSATIIISEPTALDSTSSRLILTGVNYTRIDEAGINAVYWDPVNEEHIPYKSLTHMETGVANNNQLTYIPGIYINEPKVIISPEVMESYDKRYPYQSQKVRFQVVDMQEYQTYRWRFKPRATLELGEGVTGNAVSVGVNFTSSSCGGYYSQTLGACKGTEVQSSPYTDLPPLTRQLSITCNSWGIYKYGSRGRTSSEGDYMPGSCYYYPLYWYVKLYYMVDGIWKTPVSVSLYNGYTFNGKKQSLLSTPETSGDITAFKIGYQYRTYKAYSAKGGNDYCGTGFFGGVAVTGFTSDLTDYSVLSEGTLNWTAIGS